MSYYEMIRVLMRLIGNIDINYKISAIESIENTIRITFNKTSLNNGLTEIEKLLRDNNIQVGIYKGDLIICTN